MPSMEAPRPEPLPTPGTDVDPVRPLRILFLVPHWPWPPRQGTSLRNSHLIQGAARRHRVDVLAFGPAGGAPEPEDPLAALCRRVEVIPPPQRTLLRRALDTLVHPLPDMGLRLASAQATARVRALLAAEAYDVVQVEGIEMARYGLLVRELPRGRRPCLIFDDHNVEYRLQQRAAWVDLRDPRRWHGGVYSAIQWGKLWRYERHICRSADRILAVSPPDAAALARLAPSTPVHVIPNGVDVAQWTPPPEMAPVYPAHPLPLVFTGKMDYRPNVDAVLWFAQEVLPYISGQQPVVFYVVGRDPHPRLDVLRGRPDVVITGPVEDVRPYVWQAAVYVVPLRVGGGTRFKVLEAMAGGTPVVSTSLGIEGLDLRHGREVLLADTPQAFAQAVSDLLRDHQAQRTRIQALVAAARRFVADYDWGRIVPRLWALYEEVAPKPTGP